MDIKIVDVAAKAGVSSATVSRVLNNSSSVTAATKEKVMKIIHELGYQPNAAAKNLRSQKTMAIGVIVPEINNSYYAEVIKGIENKAYAMKYKVIICDTGNNKEKELEFINLLMDKTVDSMILVTPLQSDEEICRLADLNYSVGIVGRYIEHPTIPCVFTDNVKFSRDVVNHLVEQGHREIAFLSGYADAIDSYDRLEGYLKALREHHIPFRPEWVENGNFSEQGGYKAMKRLFEKKVSFTAIYSANDEMALGVYQACAELGIQIPEQLAIVGVDNNRVSRYITPKLSTVAQPKFKMGSILVEKIIHQLEHTEITPDRVVVLDSELIIRDSSSAARK
ncbi:LacI family transcriptional regulator [Paenibacillus sp. H1-7]|uniref:LacI family DNA-binding transcriptional regulator n=1 Tax=Paenibacillus sp. H1-7 TaxID=2282849 RepID=UPI001EF86E75|nr:LacI family DNA-binding transcriptional regulator [Paenibacillus sp. H1-7]ULL19831.1 LacI family transcriptional regulator [Paenibacillus sp. H1-7]